MVSRLLSSLKYKENLTRDPYYISTLYTTSTSPILSYMCYLWVYYVYTILDAVHILETEICDRLLEVRWVVTYLEYIKYR